MNKRLPVGLFLTFTKPIKNIVTIAYAIIVLVTF